MRRWAAFFRGLNVGGTGVVPMRDLVSALESSGLDGVSSYIQSGNVVFTAADDAGLALRLEGELQARLGLTTKVILRSHAELASVIAEPGFPDVDDGTRHIGFLSAAPDPARIAALDPNRSPGDRFCVIGDHLFLHFPSGQGRSKLGLDWFERQLGVAGTIRNWRTVCAMADRTRV
jgi:uncharacterized protein (DUF1697 family)